MRGVFCDGASVRLRRDLPTPEPGSGEIVLKVRVVGICETDLQLARGYMGFRGVLGHASGFQSYQYRKLEFLLGNKNRDALKVFAHDPETHQDLLKALESPSLYDEFLRHLKRRGLAVPQVCVARNWSEPHQKNDELTQVFRQIYEHPREHWDAYEMCEKLVDVEEYFQLWRFRHMKTVERIIGFRPGTGGSSGVGFLRQALELTFFPELFAVRTGLKQR